jgi:carboxyl-terminal processing protease
MPSQHNPTSKHILLPLAIALASAIGLLAGYKMNLNNTDISLLKLEQINESSQRSNDGRIEEILRFIETNYVDSLDENIIAVDAINHILNQLDPHSSYITPEELEEHNEKMEGVYTGVGIETIKLRDTFYITQVKEGSPAFEQGLQVGDAIICINADTISGTNTSFTTMSKLLKQKAQSDIQIAYKAVDNSVTKEIKVIPAKITLQSADLSYRIADATAYIKISRFNSNTYEQFIKSLERVATEGELLNLIIDLRDNPGGFLPETINILSQLFADKDKLLTYTEGLNRKKQEYRSTGRQFFNIGKIAVLINENSASGSEILAGAVQDWDRGFIVGQASFGKGLVQEIFPLSNGGALRLTVSKYYTPSGRLIQKSYDNIEKKFEADTSDYTTMMLNRRVIGGGGVTPDIVLKDDYNMSCYTLYDYVDYYIIDKMIKSQSYDIEPIALSEEGLLSFISNEYEENVEKLSDICQADSDRHIQARLKRMQEGDVSYQQFLNIEDPYIIEALDLISNKKTTFALLSQEN